MGQIRSTSAVRSPSTDSDMWMMPSPSTGGRSGDRAPLSQRLRVKVGDDVALTCSARSSEQPSYFWHPNSDHWMPPLSTATPRNVRAADDGRFTCMTEHPTLESLNGNSVRITALPVSTDAESGPPESSNGRLIPMTSAAAAALLILIPSMSVFLRRRAKQARTTRGPIDDRSQKKPVYKGGSESLPLSACEDNQPVA